MRKLFPFTFSSPQDTRHKTQDTRHKTQDTRHKNANNKRKQSQNEKHQKRIHCIGLADFKKIVYPNYSNLVRTLIILI